MRWRLWLEFTGLFFALPLLLLFFANTRAVRIPLLVGVAIFCVWRLLTDERFDRSQLWNSTALWDKGLLLQCAGVTGVLLGLLFFIHEPVFIPAHYPLLTLAVFVFYPVLSAYPQELIYRVFLFQRYAPIFPGATSRVLASAVSFSFVHIIYGSPVVMLFTLFGGLLFSLTYFRTRSLIAVCVEHSLYGLVLFTLGAGRYLFQASAR
jgi:membrane protease YdiL (CAAX protease family)